MEFGSETRLAGFKRRARARWPVWTLSAMIALLIALIMLAEPFTPMNEDLPPLRMRNPAGERVSSAHLQDKPWLINVWLPG